MSHDSIKIATAQSEISPDVRRNGQVVRRLMRRAARANARLIHFPEAALSGYVKSQIKSWREVDWPALQAEQQAVAELAGELGIWVVVGCNQRQTDVTEVDDTKRPHNSLLIISDKGTLAGRYDKRIRSHTEITSWYAPGIAPVVFEIDGFRFGCALCIEIHFPEIFAEYERLDVDCMLFSAYSADPIFAIEAQAHAATNAFWLSHAVPAQCSRVTASSLIGPDGDIIACCRRGRSTLLIGEMNRHDPAFKTALTYARPWRRLARQGIRYEPHRPKAALIYS